MSTFIAKLTRKKHMEEDHMVTNLKRLVKHARDYYFIHMVL